MMRLLIRTHQLIPNQHQNLLRLNDYCCHWKTFILKLIASSLNFDFMFKIFLKGSVTRPSNV